MKRPKLYKGRYLLRDYLKQTDSVHITGMSEYPERLCISNGMQSGIAYNWRVDHNNIILLAQDYDGDFRELEITPINILEHDVYIASLGQSPYVMLKS